MVRSLRSRSFSVIKLFDTLKFLNILSRKSSLLKRVVYGVKSFFIRLKPSFFRKSVVFSPRFYRKSVVFDHWFYRKSVFGYAWKGKKYNGRFQIDASGTCHFLSFYANLSLSELSTTLTLEKAIRALAHIGVIWKSMPKIWRAPAANGMQMML